MNETGNQITLIGVLAEQPIQHVLASGHMRTLFTLAGIQDTEHENGEERNIPWRHRISVIGRDAHVLANYIPGVILYVEGTLQTRAKTEEDGTRRHKTEVYGHKVKQTSTPMEVEQYRDTPHLVSAINHVTLTGTLINPMTVHETKNGPIARNILKTTVIGPGRDQFSQHTIPILLRGDLALENENLQPGHEMMIHGMYLPDNHTTRDGTRIYRTVVEATEAIALSPLAHPIPMP